MKSLRSVVFCSLSGVAAVFLAISLSLASFAGVAFSAAAPKRSQGKSDGPLSYKEVFRRSVSDLSGDIFLLPQRFNYTLEDADFAPDALHKSHFSGKNKASSTPAELAPHPISAHGFAWDYDLRIPLAFYDPTGLWFKPGKYNRIAVQQDIAPTLADVLGIPAPDRSAGRILAEARQSPKSTERPRVVIVLVQDQMGLQYFTAHPDRAPFIRGLLAKGAQFTQAQVADVDVETSVGHAAISTGAYPRGHGVVGNSFWHPGLWSVSPVFSAKLTETLSSDSYPLLLDAPALADVWGRARGNRPTIFSLVAAARAALPLGGHGAMSAGGKKTAVMYLADHGKDAGSYVTDENFYFLPNAVKGKTIKPYVDAFETEKNHDWYGHPLTKPDGTVDLSSARASPALVRFESDLVTGSMDELKIGQSDETDLVFVNFKSTDYCGHFYGYESDECGEVLDAVDTSIKRLVDQLAQASGGRYLVTFTADHGAAPIPELSGGLRFNRKTLLDDLQKHFDKIDNHIDAIPFMSSSEIWVNRHELTLNGFKIGDIVRYLKQYEVPRTSPWNNLGEDWQKRGKPAKEKFFLDVVSKDDL